MKKVAFYTLGCRVNQYETEAISETFIKNGYSIVNFDDAADVYVINTCTVTSISDRKSRQMIRKAKRNNPNSIIAVVGCYAQVAPDEVSNIEGVDIVAGTNEKGNIVKLVEEYKKNKKQVKIVEKFRDIKGFEDLNISEYQDRTRAFLKIQDGCDRFCSYCLIPYARGPVRSREPESIIHEVERLSKNGYREVIFSGIHVASYGRDLNGIGLIDIIERAQNIDGIDRIRIGSVDPKFFSDNTIERISKVTKLCPHFHLSLQSGCSETLKRMNRHYTAEEYKNIVKNLRNSIKDVSVTTDVIVGFPGETDEEFETTYKFLKDIKLSKMHIFKYSSRKGTRAALMKDQVNPEVKEERSKRLIELDKVLETEFIKKFIGKDMDVLFEECSDGIFYGYTRNYIRVGVKSIEPLRDKIKNVNIVSVNGNIAEGILI